MGSLSDFNLAKIKKDYSLDVLVETGCGRGDGVLYAQTFDFQLIYSVEIDKSLFDLCKNRFQNDASISIYHGTSKDFISNLLPFVKHNTLFWLDAHYPSADFITGDYNAHDEILRLPLESELREIIRNKDITNDYFIIDDLRIYMDGDYENGNMPTHIIPVENRNIDFIYELFSGTHEIELSNKKEGYIILKPCQ